MRTNGVQCHHIIYINVLCYVQFPANKSKGLYPWLFSYLVKNGKNATSSSYPLIQWQSAWERLYACVCLRVCVRPRAFSRVRVLIWREALWLSSRFFLSLINDGIVPNRFTGTTNDKTYCARRTFDPWDASWLNRSYLERWTFLSSCWLRSNPDYHAWANKIPWAIARLLMCFQNAIFVRRGL